MENEELELAEEHVKLAEEIVEKQGMNEEGDKAEKLKQASFNLEKAESEINEVSEDKKD